MKTKRQPRLVLRIRRKKLESALRLVLLILKLAQVLVAFWYLTRQA